jgi:MYXO-CTERM domain-containing protein
VFSAPNSQWFSEQSQMFRIDVVSPVPAPGAAALLAIGGFVTARRRRA